MEKHEKEALLEEAKRKYPKGTKFKPFTKGHIYEEYVIEEELRWEGNSGISHHGIPWVYLDGKWAEIVTKPEEKPSKILIFNDIYVGDIVVSHKVTNRHITSRKEGELFLVLDKSYEGRLYYADGYASLNSDDWRKATSEEIEAYNKGIKNINDIPKKQGFIVGKWYKNLGTNNKCYGKFLKSEYNRFCISEIIDMNGKHSNVSNTHWDKDNSKNPILLEDLSEIQQYLPDGHVDKVMGENFTYKEFTYEVDKYYFYNDNVIIKFIGKNKQHPSVDTNSKRFEYYPWTLNLSRRLATQEEIKWLEACIKVNNFIPKEEALKPINDHFYIRYSAEITEDLFNRLAEKLDSIYGKRQKFLVEPTFKYFKDRGFIRSWDGKGTKETWMVDSNNQSCKIEKTIWDFISKEESSIPEYVECVNGNGWGRTFTKGVIYKVDDEKINGVSWSERLRCFPNDFKSSNKEKYEAQNKPKVMEKETPKNGEFWVFMRGNTPSKLHSADSIYEIIDTGKIKHVWNGKKEEGNIIDYTIHSETWRKATPQDLIDADITPKEPVLVEGQWYEMVTAYRWLVKFKEIKGNKLVSSKYSLKEGRNKGGIGEWVLPYVSIKPADMEEVYKHFPEERLKEKENWCVKKTLDNKQDIIKWGRNTLNKPTDGTAAFYGIRDGKYDYNSSSWGKVLTTEEFYKKIGYVTEKPMEEYEEGDWVWAKGNIYSKEYLGKVVKFREGNYNSIIDFNIAKGVNPDDNGKPVNGGQIYSNITRKALSHEIPSTPMNTYGLKVGDKLPLKATGKYAAIVGNWCGDIKSGWKGTFGSYSHEREIDSFREIDGIVGFKVSGCAVDSHYLKAEGFKEFMDNFNKPKLKKGKYYSWKGTDGTRYMQFVEKLGNTIKTSYYRWEKEGKNQNEHFSGTDVYPLENSIFKEVTEQEAKGTKTSELTSLPEKWCIKVTKENIVDLGKWRSAGPSGNMSPDSKTFGYIRSYDKGYWQEDIPTGDIEITFEQFKKWVLKSEPVKEQVMEDLTGRYLKAKVDQADEVGGIFKGNYTKIISHSGLGNYNIDWGFGDYIAAKPINTRNWELMPIGWTPDTEKKYTYEVVCCETQEQWDFVLSKFNPLGLEKSLWNKGRCITFGGTTTIGTHSAKSWFESNGVSKVYSFEEWCNKFGHVFSPEKEEFKVGDWAVSLTKTKNYIIGEVGRISKVENGMCAFEGKPQDWGNLRDFNTYRKALPHEIPGYDKSHFPKGYDQIRPKKKGFDEKEHLAKPYNQMLTISVKKQTKQKTKQLFL